MAVRDLPQNAVQLLLSDYEVWKVLIYVVNLNNSADEMFASSGICAENVLKWAVNETLISFGYKTTAGNGSSNLCVEASEKVKIAICIR